MPVPVSPGVPPPPLGIVDIHGAILFNTAALQSANVLKYPVPSKGSTHVKLPGNSLA